MEIVLNRHHDDILAIAYDNSGRPVQITPRAPLESLNVTYDSQGHMVGWSRGEFSLSYVYDERTGQLTEKKIANRIMFRYIYKSGYKVCVYVCVCVVCVCVFVCVHLCMRVV